MNSRPHNLKSEQLENHLLREILPQYRPGERVPSEVEMARQLGTSRTTMHKVYFNLISRGLLYRQSGIGTFRADRAEEPALRMITAVMPSLHLLNASQTPNWFNHQYTLEHFADAAREDHFMLNVSFFDHDRYSVDEAERLLNRGDVPAFLFPALVPELEPLIKRLRAAGKVCVGRYFKPAGFCDSAWFDIENAMEQAVAHLANSGRRRIALLDEWRPELPEIPHYGYPVDRYHAFRRALEKAELPFVSELYRFCLGSGADGEWAVRRMLEEKQNFDAVFCGTDRRAFGAIAALRKAGLRVPEDVAVVGVNNESGSVGCDPPLATIDCPFDRLARMLYELMRDRLNAPERSGTESRACPVSFLWRESAGGAPPAIV
ncbi:GntR family transcriptional regulator [Victivallis vadensis]|uniref:GntR family transcriptional regulator n=1 Tax=Victivallis vadensis TaxID=172901 RepID=UPI00307E67FF